MIYHSDYIKTANTVYYHLNEFKDVFYLESRVINYVKCELIQNKQLEDFYVDGIRVIVYGYNDQYDLYFSDYKLTIYVYDRQIIDFQMLKV